MKLNENVKRGLINTADYIKNGLIIAVPIVATALIRRSTNKMVDKIQYSNIKYDDTIKVILDSNMLSSYKQEAVALIKVNMETEYYRSVIYAVESDMLSSYKIEMIQNLNEKYEKEEEA